MNIKNWVKNLRKNQELRVLKYLAVFALLLIAIFILGCKPGDKNYATADEQYLVGQVLRNVDDNTPLVLDFRERRNDLALYNTSIDYPAYTPEYHDEAIWFFEPKSSFFSGFATINKRAAGVKKLLNIFAENKYKDTYGDNKWWLLNIQGINYLKLKDFNIAGNADTSQDTLDFSAREEFNENIVPAINKENTFGTSPYRIANLDIGNYKDKDDKVTTAIGFDKPLMTGNKGDVTLARTTEFSNFVLPHPTYKIYKNSSLYREGNLTYYGNWISYFDNNTLTDNGAYKIIIDVPSLYPIFEHITSEYEFTKIEDWQKDIRPPLINLIDIPARFEAGKLFNIRVNVSDENTLNLFKIFYSTDNKKNNQNNNNNLDDNSWLELSVNILEENTIDSKKIYLYNTSLEIADTSVEKINIKVIAIDGNSNKVISTIKSALLKARTVDFKLKTSKTQASKGDTLIFSGDCIDNLGNVCKGLKIKYYLDNGSSEEFLDNDMTKFERIYDANNNPIDEPAYYAYNWAVPISYSSNTAIFKLKFAGTGIYLPKEESVTINIGAVNYDIALSSLTIENFVFNREAKINLTITNVGLQKAENVDVKLQIDAGLVKTKIIPILEPNQAVNVSFGYTPKRTGSTSILVTSNYLKDENLDNNNQGVVRDVQGSGSDLSLSRKSKGKGNTIIINNTGTLEFSIRNLGQSKAANVSLALFDFYNDRYFWLEYSTNAVKFEGIEYKITAHNQSADDKKDNSNNKANLTFEYMFNNNLVSENFALRHHSSEHGIENIHVLKNNYAIVYENAYQNGVAIGLGNIIYSTTTLADLDANEERDENITWGTKVLGWHSLYSFVKAENEVDYSNNLYLTTLNVIKDLPDLQINSFEIKEIDRYVNWLAIVNKEYNVSVEIENIGVRDSNEFNATFIDFYLIQNIYLEDGRSQRVFIDNREYSVKARINYSDNVAESSVELEVSYVDTSNNNKIERFTLGLGDIATLQTGTSILIERLFGSKIPALVLSFGNAKQQLIKVPSIKAGIENSNRYGDNRYSLEFKWKPNKTGEHKLILDAKTDYDGNLDNNRYVTSINARRDLPQLEVSRIVDWQNYNDKAIIGKVEQLTYKITNYGVRNATNVDAIFYDLYNRQRESLELSNTVGNTQDTIENEIYYNNTLYVASAKLVELPEEEQTQQYKKIASIKIRYSYHGQEVNEEFRLLRNGVYQLRNGVFIKTDYDDDNQQRDIFVMFSEGNKQVKKFSEINIDNENNVNGNIEKGDNNYNYTFTVNWLPNVLDAHDIIMFVNLSDDGDWTNNIYTDYIRVVNDGPDLFLRDAMVSGQIKNYWQYITDVNSLVNISVKIENIGSKDSNNAKLEVSAIKQVEDSGKKTAASEKEEKKEIRKSIASENIGTLASGQSTTINISFNINETGEYILFLYVNDTLDTDPYNNNYDFWLKVISTAAFIQPTLELEYPILPNKQVQVEAKLDNIMPVQATNISAYLFEQKLPDARRGSPKAEVPVTENGDKKEEPLVLINSAKINSIAGNSQKLLSFNWTPREYASYRLLLVVNYTSENDAKIYENSQTHYVETEVNSSDIAIDFIYLKNTYKEVLEINKQVQVRASVSNIGLRKAENIKVKLFANNNINNVLVEEKTIIALDKREGTSLDFTWTPALEGDYVLRAVAEAQNDYTTLNNEYNLTVAVGRIMNISVNITNAANNPIVREIARSENLAWKINGTGNIKLNSKEPFLFIANRDDLSKRFDDAPGVSFLYSLPVVQDNLTIKADTYELNKPQQHLFIKNIYANKISWQYEKLFFITIADISKINNLNLEVYDCESFDFANKTCLTKWHKSKHSGINLYNRKEGTFFIASAEAQKAEAFAIAERDFDEDRVPDREDNDDDNDGIADDRDKVKGNNTLARTNMKNLKLRIADKENFSEFNVNDLLNKTEVVKFVEDNKPRLEFKFNFTNNSLDLSNIAVETKQDGISGGILISGLVLDKNETKTAYIDDISRSNEVCIKDIEFNLDEMSFSNITQACNSLNETLLFCPGSVSAQETGASYSCENITLTNIDNNNTGNNSTSKLYKISGLRNSGVQELPNCIEKWSCTDWSSCSSNKQTRTCNDIKKCGTTTSIPALEQSCGSRDRDRSGGGGSSGSRSGELISIGILDKGIIKSVEIKRYDRVRFVMGNNQYNLELEQLGKSNAEVSIKPGYAGVSLVLTTPLRLDLNNNGINDVIIILTNINNDKAAILLQNLNEAIETEQNLSALTPPRNINRTISAPEDVTLVVQNITVAKKDKKDDKKIEKDYSGIKGWALLFLMILTFIFVMMYVLKEQEKKKRERRRWAIERYYMEHGKLPVGIKQEDLQHLKHHAQNKNMQQHKTQHHVQATAQHAAHHEVLKMFVKDLKEKNYSKEQILQELVTRGWDPREVQHVIKMQESREVYSNIDSLIAFAEEALSSGYKLDQIAKSLHQKGWPKEVIGRVFKEEKRLRKYLR